MNNSMIGLIVDAAVVLVVVLLIIFGTWRGMYKLIFGLVSGLLSIVLAIVLVGTVTSFVVEKTELETALNGALNPSIVKVIPEDLHAEQMHVVFTGEDGVSVVDDESGTVYESVSAYVEQSGSKLKPVASILDSLVKNKSVRASYTSTDDNGETISQSPTLADLLCVTITTYILLAIVFITLWIVAYVVLRLLMLLIKKLVTQTYVGHFVNKLIGFVIGAAIGMIVVWGALAVIRLLGTYTWIIPVNNVIGSSTLTKWLYDNNYLYTFLVETMNLQETIAKIVGSFSGGGGQ